MFVKYHDILGFSTQAFRTALTRCLDHATAATVARAAHVAAFNGIDDSAYRVTTMKVLIDFGIEA